MRVEFLQSVTVGNEFKGPTFEDGTVRFIKVGADMTHVARLCVLFFFQEEGKVLLRVGSKIHGVNVHRLTLSGFYPARIKVPYIRCGRKPHARRWFRVGVAGLRKGRPWGRF